MGWQAIIGVFMLLGGVSAVFDHILNEEQIAKTRGELSRWYNSLRGVDSKVLIKTANNFFIRAFDDIYGERHFSLKTFLRSCLASVFALIVGVTVCGLFRVGSC